MKGTIAEIAVAKIAERAVAEKTATKDAEETTPEKATEEKQGGNIAKKASDHEDEGVFPTMVKNKRITLRRPGRELSGRESRR